MDNAKIYKCFIASPSDVMEERNACEEIFESINKSIGESQLFRIESVRWEKDAVPEFASDGQDVINRQLTPGGHDIFVGIFGKKFGSPTPRAASGSKEEFDQAYSSWKKTGAPQIQLYFKPDFIPESEVESQKIKDFKDTVASDGGLYSEYNDLEDFKNKFRINITKTILKMHHRQVQKDYFEHIDKQLDKQLEDAMGMFDYQSVKWLDRRLCKVEDMSDSLSESIEKSTSIENIIIDNQSCIIQAPPQFGLTCLAHKIRKTAWHLYNMAYAYIDVSNVKIRKLDHVLKSEMLFFEREQLSGIIIDSLGTAPDDTRKIFDAIDNLFPHIKLIIMQTKIDSFDALIMPPISEVRSFAVYNLLALPKSDIRMAVRSCVTHLKHDEDTVLNKIVSDMEVLNMHRTPMNCWTLLKVAENNFDKNPVNRTQVLKLVLTTIFNFVDIPMYKTAPDENDCEHVLGVLAEKILKEKKLEFSKQYFLDTIDEFCKDKLIYIDIDALWNILFSNKIIIELAHDVFRFKSSFWIYFFAANRMEKSPEFKKFVFSSRYYSHFPEIIEFYTGITRDKTDVLEHLSADLAKTRETMIEKLGFPPGTFNPLRFLKWEPQDTDIEKMKTYLSGDVSKSSAPQHIKDQHADSTYNHLTPYNQDLHKFLQDASFTVFVYQLRALSRALRNSDYAAVTTRVRIFSEIVSGWNDFAKVMFLLAPILAQFGHASFGGYGFFLDRTFHKFEKKDLLLAIIQAAPYNVLRFVKDDISSDRMAPLIEHFFKNSLNEVSEHILALFLISQRPAKWVDIIKQIIAKHDKNSFYLGNIYYTLCYYYQFDYMSTNDMNATKILIKACVAKHQLSIPSPSMGEITRLPNSILPDRKNDLLRNL